jgi:hypothetical protein
MTITVILKNEKEYIFYGVNKCYIENGQHLKLSYVGILPQYNSTDEIIENKACFMLDAIAGYYIEK